jgi:hypothetical protein
MSTEEYLCWNDRSVAHIFLRLITKTKFLLIVDPEHPYYNDNLLTLDEFNEDYKMLEGYIEWKRINQPMQNLSLYNFTPDSMTSFLSLINYDTNNRDELIELWENVMMKGTNVTYLPKVNDKSYLLSRL